MVSTQVIKVAGETAATDHMVDLMVETNRMETMNHTAGAMITTTTEVVTIRAAMIQVC